MNAISEDTSIDDIDFEQELKDNLKRSLLTNKISKSLDEKKIQSNYVLESTVNNYLDNWIKVSINDFSEKRSKSLDLSNLSK